MQTIWFNHLFNLNFCKKNSSMSFFSIDINSARMCSILSMSIPLLPGILLKINRLDYIFLGITDEKYCGRICFPFFKFLVWRKVGCSLLFPKCKKNKKLQLQKLKLASYHKTPSVEKKPHPPAFVMKLAFLVALWVWMPPLQKKSQPITMW